MLIVNILLQGEPCFYFSYGISLKKTQCVFCLYTLDHLVGYCGNLNIAVTTYIFIVIGIESLYCMLATMSDTCIGVSTSKIISRLNE